MFGKLNHYEPVAIRVNGSGVLRCTLISLDEERTLTLPTITMSSSSGRETQILAGMVEQSAQLEFRTTAIDEVFNISRIIIGVAPIFEEYPK